MKVQNNLFLLIIVSMFMLPITVFADINQQDKLENEQKLYQVIHDVTLDENIKLYSDSLVYGEELDGNIVKVQYKDSALELEKEVLQEIDSIPEEYIPEFHTYEENLESGIDQVLNNQLLIGSSLSKSPTIHITNETSFTVFNREDMEYIIIGNTAHFLSSATIDDTEETIEDNEERETNHEESKPSIEVEAQPSIEVEAQSSNLANENTSAKFFKVKKDTPIYIEKSGELVKVGELVKDQIYPRIEAKSEWNLIQFGDYNGLVAKTDTEPIEEAKIDNLNTNYSIKPNYFTPINDLTVYDNSSGKLIPFGKIKAGQQYNVAYDYGGKWLYIIFADRVGYVKVEDVVKNYFKNSDRYFLANENLPVYDNRSGKLIQVGELVAGQVYPRYESSPKWHMIQFGDYKAFVKKEGTQPVSGNEIKNINKTYSNQNNYFTAKHDLIVYDNSSGTLEPFGVIKKDQSFSIAHDYGGKWIYVIYSDRVGFVNKEDVKRNYFLPTDKYFKVVEENVPIYDRRDGKLVQVGELEKGQIYPRYESSPKWHLIQFSNKKVFVKKEGTEPVDEKVTKPTSIYEMKYKAYIAKVDTTIYSNEGGKLEPIGKLKKGELYHISRDYGGKWIYIKFADLPAFIPSDTVTAKKSFNDNHHYFSVLQEGVPIYDNRSGKLKKVGQLVSGETYKREVNQSSPKWHAINYNGYYVYVPEEFTEPSKASKVKNWTTESDKSINLKLIANKDIDVYDNSTGKLKAFAKILKGQEYTITKDYGGDWLYINIANRTGFVKNSEVTKEKIVIYKNVVNPRQVYTYRMMESDIMEFAKIYPDLITWKTIGKSVDGRNLYAIKLGKGKKEVYFNGSTHAREWLTTNLLMEMIDEYSQAYVKNQKYHGYNVKEILDNTSIWFVPMVNPDGVTLVQKGASVFKNSAELIRLNNGSKNFDSWKANIRGVDLNRQYPTDWNLITNSPRGPAPYNFKGYLPLTEPEAVALMNFSKQHDFKTEVAYHSSGEILYFGDDKFKPNSYMYNLSKKIANMVYKKTGYSLYYTRGLPGGGTYTDWVQGSMNRVGLTPEISPYVGNRPVPVSSFDSIWKKNNTIGLMIAKEAYLR